MQRRHGPCACISVDFVYPAVRPLNTCDKFPPVLRCSYRQVMTKNKSKKTAHKSDYRRTSTSGNSTTSEMTKDTASFIEKLAEKDSKRKKKKEAKKTEDGIVRRLAKHGRIDKDKVKAAQKSSSKAQERKKKKEGLSSSSSSYSDSSSSSTDSSSDSDDSSSDGKKTKSMKRKSRKDDNDDKSSAKAKCKAKKENKIQKFTQSRRACSRWLLSFVS